MLALGIAFYLMPLIIVLFRKPVAGVGIVLFSLLLGWTLIGWVVALCWASYGKTRADMQRDEAIALLLIAASKEEVK